MLKKFDFPGSSKSRLEKTLNKCAMTNLLEDALKMVEKEFSLEDQSDWLKHDAEKVEALGMNFMVKNAGSADAIWQS